MRRSLAVIVFAGCLGLAGCKLFDGRKPSSSSASSDTPFMGSSGSGGAPASATTSAEGRGSSGNATLVGGASLPDDVNGLLAGHILGKYNPSSATVYIQVEGPNEASSSGRLWKRARNGVFSLQGLKAGHEYKLTVVVREGERILVGQKKAVPPDPRWWVEVREGPLPAGVVLPGSTATLPGGEKGRPTSVPAASLDPPVRTIPGDSASVSGGPVSPPPPPPAPPPSSPSAGASNLIGHNGFAKAPTAPNVAVPGPGRETAPVPEPPTRYMPPPPPTEDRTVPPLTVPSTAPSAAIRPLSALALPAPAGSPSLSSPAPVPSCLIVGRKVENFALYGLDGQPWELRKHRRGRLVLIDFWYSTCGPCLGAIGHLRELQRMYGSYGLEVVGIAYEKGTAEEQVRKVRAVRARYGVNYTTLLGGGGTGPCPVKAQFRIAAFPTLVLIDETGQIIWRSEGLDEMQLYQLKVEVHRRLGLPLR